MIKAIISDFSKVLLFPKDKEYKGKLNQLHEDLVRINPDYNVWDYFILNKGLLNFFTNISNSISLYIFTTKYIQEYPPIRCEIEGMFKKIYVSSEMNVKKNQSIAYAKLIELVGLKSNNVLYIDDSSENINAASKAGLQTILYQDVDQIINSINKLIIH